MTLSRDVPTLFNVGSLNADWVYHVDEIVRPGQTLAACSRSRFAGGKGANQSVAAAAAGAKVRHIGCIGPDGAWLRDELDRRHVDTRAIRVSDDTPTGHAVIQIDSSGENAIVLFPGANHQVTPDLLAASLADARPGDWLLTQNETSRVAEALRLGQSYGLRTVFNPAPAAVGGDEFPLDLIDLLIVNETEAAVFSDAPTVTGKVQQLGQWVRGTAVLTMGGRGSLASDGGDVKQQPAVHVDSVVDTTGAGDTFIGYLVASLMGGKTLVEALEWAAYAAALAVTRAGAIPGIPTGDQVAAFRTDR
ncbi:MAG: ribokinase [Planctomycetota bacterium]